MTRVEIKLYTERLTVEEEGNLIDALDQLRYKVDDENDYCPKYIYLEQKEVELPNMPFNENDEAVYGLITLEGYITDALYDELYDILDEYDLTVKDKAADAAAYENDKITLMLLYNGAETPEKKEEYRLKLINLIKNKAA